MPILRLFTKAALLSIGFGAIDMAMLIYLHGNKKDVTAHTMDLKCQPQMPQMPLPAHPFQRPYP